MGSAEDRHGGVRQLPHPFSFPFGTVAGHDEREAFTLLTRAVAGVLKNVQEGCLPLFSWAFGLPQAEWQRLIGPCFPELRTPESAPPEFHRQLRAATSEQFAAMAALFSEHRDPHADVQESRWAAQVIAAGCMGCRPLYQDLGLRGRDEVSALMAAYFGALCAGNRQQLHWKRFLFAELAMRHGDAFPIRPNCSGCDNYGECFADGRPDDTGR